jgi:hypothetical protein
MTITLDLATTINPDTATTQAHETTDSNALIYLMITARRTHARYTESHTVDHRNTPRRNKTLRRRVSNDETEPVS